MKKRKTTTIRLTTDIKQKLEQYARILDISQSDIIREAIASKITDLDKRFLINGIDKT